MREEMTNVQCLMTYSFRNWSFGTSSNLQSPVPNPPIPLPMSVFIQIDDKHVPLWRVAWISELPHFCGSADCAREGQYEVRLDNGESVWGSQTERDATLEALEAWREGV